MLLACAKAAEWHLEAWLLGRASSVLDAMKFPPGHHGDQETGPRGNSRSRRNGVYAKSQTARLAVTVRGWQNFADLKAELDADSEDFFQRVMQQDETRNSVR